MNAKMPNLLLLKATVPTNKQSKPHERRRLQSMSSIAVLFTSVLMCNFHMSFTTFVGHWHIAGMTDGS